MPDAGDAGRGGKGGFGGAGGMGPGGVGGGGAGPAAGGNGGTPVLGSCFEIFPSLVNAGPGAGPVMYHVNPLDVNLGTIKSGQSASVSILYFNFCGDKNAKLLGVDLTATLANGAPDTSFAVEANPIVGSAILGASSPTLRITFTPKSAGPHEAIVRYRITHGDYVTRIKAVGS